MRLSSRRSYDGWMVESVSEGGHRGLPSRFMTLIVSIGAEVDVVAQTDPDQAPSRYRRVFGGL